RGRVADARVLVRAADDRLLRLPAGGVLAGAGGAQGRPVRRVAAVRDGLRLLVAPRPRRLPPGAHPRPAGLLAPVRRDEDTFGPFADLRRNLSRLPGARRLRLEELRHGPVAPPLPRAGGRPAAAPGPPAGLRGSHGVPAPQVGQRPALPQTPAVARGPADPAAARAHASA